MEKLTRKEIHLIGRNSTWSTTGIEETLNTHVNNSTSGWQKFIKIFVIGVGASFLVAGIVFFFAYNWDALNKFVKIGMVQSAIILLTLLLLFSKVSQLSKNVILACLTVLVGVLFAVFGQIYQTGANAYDFFLGWTLAVTIWVIISNYGPTWLIFMILVNTTIILYFEQVEHGWSYLQITNLVFLFNAVVLSILLLVAEKFKPLKFSNWFYYLVALASLSMSTLGLSFAIHEPEQGTITLALASLVLYSLSVLYGLAIRNSFYIAIIAFSLIIIISSALLKMSSDAGMFSLISLFIVGAITLTIKQILRLQNLWKNE